MKRLFSFTLFCLGLFAAPAWSAPPNEKPTMSPELSGGSSEKRDPFGVKGLTKDRPKDAKTEITSKKQATFDNASSVAEFDGSVVVKDPQFTLFCDHLKVTLGKDRKGLQLVEAFGNVIIVQENTDEAGKKVEGHRSFRQGCLRANFGRRNPDHLAIGSARYQHAGGDGGEHDHDSQPQRQNDHKRRQPNRDCRQ